MKPNIASSSADVFRGSMTDVFLFKFIDIVVYGLLHTDINALLQLRGSTLARATKAVVRREGIRGLYGGFWAVAAGAG